MRNDRAFGAMGGCSGIYYTAISQYCRDHLIKGSEFRLFLRLIREMDDEYMSHVAAPAATTQDQPS